MLHKFEHQTSKNRKRTNNSPQSFPVLGFILYPIVLFVYPIVLCMYLIVSCVHPIVLCVYLIVLCVYPIVSWGYLTVFYLYPIVQCVHSADLCVYFFVKAVNYHVMRLSWFQSHPIVQVSNPIVRVSYSICYYVKANAAGKLYFRNTVLWIRMLVK